MLLLLVFFHPEHCHNTFNSANAILVPKRVRVRTVQRVTRYHHSRLRSHFDSSFKAAFKTDNVKLLFRLCSFSEITSYSRHQSLRIDVLAQRRVDLLNRQLSDGRFKLGVILHRTIGEDRTRQDLR